MKKSKNQTPFSAPSLAAVEVSPHAHPLQTENQIKTSIIIGGFGAAGAAMALALVKSGVAAHEIVLFDAHMTEQPQPSNQKDARILALHQGSCAFLENIGLGQFLAEQSFPMFGFRLSDSERSEKFRHEMFALRSQERAFPQEGDDQPPIARLVSLHGLTTSLRAACRAAGLRVMHGKFIDSTCETAHIHVKIQGDTTPIHLSGALLIAADGGASPIRSQAGITTIGWPYHQTAITGIVHHSLPHKGLAIQHFLSAGPFALLPLDEYRSSMIWSEDEIIAQEMLALPPHQQRQAIEARAAGWLGSITKVETLSSHPLRLRLSQSFIAPRRVLVADAAHIVHPLAGQGLNLGLEDVALLAALIGENRRLGLDIGATELLKTYQAYRRPPTLAMATVTEAINRLFSQESSLLRGLRHIGLTLAEKSPQLKGFLARAASGNQGNAPPLFKR